MPQIPDTLVVPGPPSSVAAVTATDARGDEPYVLLTRPNMLGNPPIAYTHRPVAVEVAAVFTKALQVRGMVAAAAPYRIRLTLHRLGGNTYFNAHIYDGPVTDNDEAYIAIDLTLTDRSGRTIYQDTVKDGRELDTPPAARNDGTLRALLQALLSATADRMLDNPAFRTAITPR